MVWQEDWSLDAGLAEWRCILVVESGGLEASKGALYWALPNSNVAVELRRQQFMGVWRSGSACRLQRQTRAILPSGGDQQKQPLVQVSPEYSRSSK